MAIAFVASTGVSAHVEPADPCTTGAVNTTGAQLLIVTIGSYPDNGGAGLSEVVTVTDSKGNTWTRAGTVSTIAGSDQTQIWYSVPTSSKVGESHTFSGDFEASTYATVCAAAYNGFTGTPTLDQVTGATGSGTALDGGNLVTTVADSLIIGTGTHLDGGGSGSGFTAGTNFTIRGQYSNSSVTATNYLEDRVVAATGTYATPATATGSAGWAARGANFYDLVAGGAANPKGPIDGIMFAGPLRRAVDQ